MVKEWVRLTAFSFSSSGRDALLAAPVRPLVLSLALPSLAAMLATGLCTLLDALLLARHAPDVSSAAGLCFPIVSLQQTIGFTLGMGAGCHLSRALGSGESDGAQRTAAFALLLAAALGLSLMAVGFFFLTPMLTLLGASDAALPHAAAYAKPLLLAAPLSCTGLVLSSLLRGQGKTTFNMIAYAVSAAAGIALDWLLIPRRGALGAGLSLLVREAFACLMLAAFTLKARHILRPALRGLSFHPRMFLDLMQSGLPTLLRQGTSSLSGAMLSRAASAFGPAALSGMGIAVRALALITSASIGFGQGFSPVCGANHGAGRPERVKESYRFCMKALTLALLIAGALIYACSGRLLALFDAEAQVAAFAVRVLRAQCPVLAFQGAVILMTMLTQSKGQTLRASLIGMSRQGLFFIPALLLLPRAFGETGLVLAQSVADILALLFSLAVLRCGNRGLTESHTDSTIDAAHPGR